MNIAIKESSMGKLSPFIEGALSMVVLMPSITYASPRFIDLPKQNTTRVEAVTPSQPWVEVGMNMRQVAKKRMQNLDNWQRGELEVLLYESE